MARLEVSRLLGSHYKDESVSRNSEAIAQEIRALDLEQILDDKAGVVLAESRLIRARLRMALEVEWLRTVGDGLRNEVLFQQSVEQWKMYDPRTNEVGNRG